LGEHHHTISTKNAQAQRFFDQGLTLDPPQEMAGYEAVQKALALASGATEGGQAYIHALAKRYSSDPKVDLRKLDADYARAMREMSINRTRTISIQPLCMPRA
jgi:hypothetical protein